MTTALPGCKSLLLRADGSVLHATINRPESRNALSQEVVEELDGVAAALETSLDFRVLVLRGAGGTFCAGGDIKGFMEALAADAPANPKDDPVAKNNRRYGDLLLRLNGLPQTLIAVVEGAAFGGGLGLICISDIAICMASAKFALSETGLGIPPAQIAPFVVQRIGLTATRNIALSGARFKGGFAKELGLVHHLAEDEAALEARLAQVLTDISKCAPYANAATKQILMESLHRPVGAVLDDAAAAFAKQLRGPEGQEGVIAFVEKRSPYWVERF
ncbi:MAG: enoyl-CoA hydratase/isomerase family protein [Candidatus Hydrogenedentes bacterium]|nr:enoyl-CoA hydratase/isomerase family protein [Candidatus Hydrogenedentota bacterium]